MCNRIDMGNLGYLDDMGDRSERGDWGDWSGVAWMTWIRLLIGGTDVTGERVDMGDMADNRGDKCSR